MKKILLIIALLLLVVTKSVCQNIPKEYFILVKQADSLYKTKEYANAAFKYSEAFKSNKWKGTSKDRYRAACSWALAAVSDSAFFHLNRIATLMNFTNYSQITKDSSLISLHKDERWQPLIELIQKNKNIEEANYDTNLISQLDTIYNDDQNYRRQLNELEKQYGWQSSEVQKLWQKINRKDSINLSKITAIIDKYGWLGKNIIGEKGNSTLFLVIQHADLKTQQKYLPIMRDAVSKGKANAGSLALLEDRVALGMGKSQIYGSQIMQDATGKYLQPLIDPKNVNERRMKVGLGSIEEYLQYFGLKWDVEEYIKKLPDLKLKYKIVD